MAEELQREMTGIGGISAVAAATAAVLTTKVEDKMKSPRMTKPAATTTVAPKASLRTTLPKTQTSLIPVPKTPVPPKPFTGTLNFKKTVSERNGTKITTSRPITASKVSLSQRPAAKSATTAPAPLRLLSSTARSAPTEKRPTTLTSKTTTITFSADKTSSTNKVIK
ncbi:salivary glue protein Sgs-3-like [Diabrotica virgifera virgifera]|uniref:Uncharacterized protein n=1 Tax=Diabrotica virgifera virgifera TaxID=50390 RepID=A0ABM5IK01_DIAVI|nr:salivary glue protein Sgs-3-like [Diabrotica virgifera virgifera]